MPTFCIASFANNVARCEYAVLSKQTHLEDDTNDNKEFTGEYHVGSYAGELMSGDSSYTQDTTLHEPMNDDTSIAHFSFASRRPHGGKHHGANARAPYKRAVNKVRN